MFRKSIDRSMGEGEMFRTHEILQVMIQTYRRSSTRGGLGSSNIPVRQSPPHPTQLPKSSHPPKRPAQPTSQAKHTTNQYFLPRRLCGAAYGTALEDCPAQACRTRRSHRRCVLPTHFFFSPRSFRWIQMVISYRHHNSNPPTNKERQRGDKKKNNNNNTQVGWKFG